MSIQVEHLTKQYGRQRAVDAISFSVREGEIAGFLGPNGAGKSTTMKIITGFLPPTSGVVRVAGENVTQFPGRVKRQTGYLPEHNPLYEDMYVHEYLHFMAGLHDFPRSKRKSRVLEMVQLCGLTIEQNKRIAALSKGFRQRLGLAQALLHNPKVLVLDEPTSGLDPNQLVEVRKLIKTVSKEKTVLFSTHILQEAEALCDRVIVINQGKIVADDKLSVLREGKGAVIVEFTEEVSEEDLRKVAGEGDVTRLERNRFRIGQPKDSDIRQALVRFAADRNLSLVELKREEGSLASIFGQLTNAQEKEVS